MREFKGGYTRRLLRVDLGSETYEVEEKTEDFCINSLGGRSLGIRLLWEELSPEVDPLSEENIIIFCSGPFAGTSFPTGSRAVLVTKSPLTGIYLYSIAGARLGRALKKAGYDALIIKGKSSVPTNLIIDDEKVLFQDAGDTWGLEVTPTTQKLRAEVGSNFSIAAIGPAGEKMVKFAAVNTDDCRSFGRGGGGAVMGSKNLKAVAIRGSAQVKPVHPERFKAGLAELLARIKNRPGPRIDFPRFGTADGPAILSGFGILPTYNWSQGTFAGAEEISMPYLRNKGYVQKDVGCHTCPVKCGKRMVVNYGDYAGARCDGPEYETLYALGANCGIKDVDFIIAANMLCDELGLDTISTGVTISFAMECFKKGIINKADTGGLTLDFGNKKAAMSLIKSIAYRQGLGDLLAEGTRKASAKLGKGSISFAMQCKGMELGGYDPRGALGQAIVFAAGNRGGCHHSIGLVARQEINQGTQFITEGKALLVREAARTRILLDSLCGCSFALDKNLDSQLMVDLLQSLTGHNYDSNCLLTIADDTNTLERAFNIREGITQANDCLPDRLLKEPLPYGLAKGRKVSLEKLQAMLNEYYRIMGWDDTGKPTEEQLTRLIPKNKALEV